MGFAQPRGPGAGPCSGGLVGWCRVFRPQGSGVGRGGGLCAVGAPGVTAGFRRLPHVPGGGCLTLPQPISPLPTLIQSPAASVGWSAPPEGGNRAGTLGLEPGASQSPELVCSGAACGPGLGRQQWEWGWVSTPGTLWTATGRGQGA